MLFLKEKIKKTLLSIKHYRLIKIKLFNGISLSQSP